MRRIPTHTVEDAPAASRPLLQKLAQSPPTGRLLNAYGQMAHSPAVLAAYTSLRAVIAEHGTVGPKVAAALTLATAAAVGNGYTIGIASRLALTAGWAEEEVAALRTGVSTGDPKMDGLTRLVREAAAHSGNVTDATWKAAGQAGWSDEQLTEAFAYLGLALFSGYFLNYAQTETGASW
jgi:Carboxymuconolactone decarboxylase family